MAFVPSKTLGIYVGRMFLLRFLAFLFALILVLQTLDLLNEADSILAGPGNTQAALLVYVKLRLPQLASQFAPFAVLLAALVTLFTLNANSEVVIMKSAGISAHQVLMPLFATAILIAVAHFIFNETVLVRSNAVLTAWQDMEYGAKPPAPTGMKRDITVEDGAYILHAADITQAKGTVLLNDVVIYQLGPTRNIVHTTMAASATLGRGEWLLKDVRDTDIATLRVTKSAERAWPSTIPAERIVAQSVDPSMVSYAKLRNSLSDLRKTGHSTSTLQAALYHKISGPLAALLMPLLGAVAAFGTARSGKQLMRAAAGLLLGFAFFVADNFMMAMGQFGAVTPFLAAWAPFTLFFLIGESVLLRSEE
jgi:lipopolysaccharide export system permease protein